MVTEHPLHIQVFDTDGLVFTHQQRWLFLQEIIPLIGYLLMYSGNSDPLFVSVLGTFLLPGKSALLSYEFSHRAFQISGIWYCITITVGIELFDPNINPDHSAIILTWVRFEVNIQDRKIFSWRRMLNGHMMDLSNFHRLTHFDKTKFWKSDISSHNADIIFLVYGPVWLEPVMFTFEDWMGRPLLKKIHKSPVEIP